MSEDIDKVKEVAYNTRARLDTHEAQCVLRYEQILEKLNLNNSQIEHLTAKLNEISSIVQQSKTSLATMIWLASAGAGVFTFLVFVLKSVRII